MNKEEIHIITLGDIFKNIETEEKAFKFLEYVKRLQNNWNELKDWLEDERKFSECGRTCISGMIFIGQNEQVYTGVIKKMQEIEGGVDNE